ncbi:maleylpyruvate isomerase family mycothiol-dependent enzyme [Spirillospora sp. NPDC047279]|uniref:maleylpyruvate isomerase family mycothiol-dependent enzyme n=1 Tax=Spirillospora sp. NPDC047279 TaxID=3155478 RepID=UPI0033C652D8
MEQDAVWRAIDDQRLSLAALFDDLSADEWERASLCEGWRVRDVAAHLTLAQTGFRGALPGLLRARGSLDRMIRDSAIRQAALPVESYAALLRDMVGSRGKAPVISHLEPLIDVLVHGQDIAIPLSRTRPMPADAAVAAAARVWPSLWPFRAGRRLAGMRLVATDHAWNAGEGLLVEGPISALLLVMTGRRAALPLLTGPGVPKIEARMAKARNSPRGKR